MISGNEGTDTSADGKFLDNRVEPTTKQKKFLEVQYSSLNLIEIPKRNKQYPNDGFLSSLSTTELKNNVLTEIKYKQYGDYGNLSGL